VKKPKKTALLPLNHGEKPETVEFAVIYGGFELLPLHLYFTIEVWNFASGIETFSQVRIKTKPQDMNYWVTVWLILR